jgi:histidinol phosphatase-like PHP family hydrolase
MIPQDLHIHTKFSTGDSSIVPQQTPELIASVGHAEAVGISDHIEYLYDSIFYTYTDAVRKQGFRLGAEIVQEADVDYALSLPLDYRVFHCYDEEKCYRAAERMVDSGVPLIIAHPMALGTDLSRIPRDCIVEINNRYVWRGDWKTFFTPWLNRFDFVFSSDAHQPHWLNQNVARHVGASLGIQETLLFGDRKKKSVA